VLKVAEYAYCVESDHGDPDACAVTTGLDQVKLKQCVTGDLGKHANARVGRQTASLHPQHTGTPWVLVNGHNIDASNLLVEVCASYKGFRKPKGCTGIHAGIRKRVVELSKIPNYNHTCNV